MDGYIQISLSEMLEQLGEDRVKDILSSFSCPINKDIEHFLKHSAITMAKQNIAPTHLVFSQYKGKIVLIGYFTITLKTMYVKKKGTISSNLKKRISKFGTFNEVLDRFEIPAPLIAQLGKNYTDNYNTLITGDELLKMACEKISMVQSIIGGKIVYIECENKPKLVDFYDSNGFVNFGKRQLDKDELGTLDGRYLLQMLKYINI
ncbi:MAG: N-acetyltransferase [Acutalibacteraceae bacterium]